MTQPPLRPIQTTKGNVNYFEHLVGYVQKRIDKERESGNGNIDVTLNFEGYNNLINEYKNLELNDPDKAWALAKDFNMWIEYFSSLNSIFEDMYLDSETHKMREIATASYEADTNSVANGTRLANKDNRVIEARKTRNIYKAFYNELTKKMEFLEKAYYHCKSTYQLYEKKKEADEYDKANKGQ